MDYIKEFSLQGDINDISKIRAFIMLINDNDEFKVKLKGFEDLIKEYHSDITNRLQKEIQEKKVNEEKLENEIKDLKSNLAKSSKGSYRERKRLQSKIKNVTNNLEKSRLESNWLIRKHKEALQMKNDSEIKLTQKIEKLRLEKLGQEKSNNQIVKKLDTEINKLKNEAMTYKSNYTSIMKDYDSLIENNTRLLKSNDSLLNEIKLMERKRDSINNL